MRLKHCGYSLARCDLVSYVDAEVDPDSTSASVQVQRNLKLVYGGGNMGLMGAIAREVSGGGGAVLGSALVPSPWGCEVPILGSGDCFWNHHRLYCLPHQNSQTTESISAQCEGQS